MKKIILPLLCACAIGLTGCVTVDSVFGEQDKQISNVELQALQTREFDTSYEIAFASVVSVFQNYGYTIQSADKDTGLVLAKTTTDATLNRLMGYVRNEDTRATAFLEKVSASRIKIRISLVKHVSASGTYGMKGEKEAAITRPEVYQEMFKQLQQAMFLKKNL